MNLLVSFPKKLICLIFIFILQIPFITHSQTTDERNIQPIRDMQWSPDGNFLAVAQHEGGLAIYDPQLTLLTSIYPQDTVSSVSW
nr:hypothetical protein [Anaerolineae bacterium]